MNKKYTPPSPSESGPETGRGFENQPAAEYMRAQENYDRSVVQAHTNEQMRLAALSPDSSAERWFFNNSDTRSKDAFLDRNASDFGKNEYIRSHFEEFGLARIANVAVVYKEKINALPTPTPQDRKIIADFVTNNGYLPIDGSPAPDFIGRDRDGKKGSFWGELCSFFKSCGPFDTREQIAIFEVISLIHPSHENHEQNFEHLSRFTLLPKGAVKIPEKKEKGADYSEQKNCWELLKSGTSLRDIIDQYYLSRGLYITIEDNQYHVYERSTGKTAPKEIQELSEYLQKNETNTVPAKALFKLYIAETITRGNRPNTQGVSPWNKSLYAEKYKQIQDIESELQRRSANKTMTADEKEKMRQQIIAEYKTNILNSNGLPGEKMALINVLSNSHDYPQNKYPDRQVGTTAKFGTAEWVQDKLRNPMTSMGQAMVRTIPGVIMMVGVGLGFKLVEKVFFGAGDGHGHGGAPKWFKDLKQLALVGTGAATLLSATGAGEYLADKIADKKGISSNVTQMLEGLPVGNTEHQKTLTEFHDLLSKESPSIQNALTGQTETEEDRIDMLDLFLYFGRSSGGKLADFYNGFMMRNPEKQAQFDTSVAHVGSRLKDIFADGDKKAKYQRVFEKMYTQTKSHYGEHVNLEEAFKNEDGTIKSMSQIIREVYWKDGADRAVAPTTRQEQTSRETTLENAMSDPEGPINPEHQNNYRQLMKYLLGENRMSAGEYKKAQAVVAHKYPHLQQGSWAFQREALTELSNAYANKIASQKMTGSTLSVPTLTYILGEDNGKKYMDTLSGFESQILSEYKAPLLGEIGNMRGNLEGLVNSLRTDSNQNAHKDFYMQLMYQIDSGSDAVEKMTIKKDIDSTKKDLENMYRSVRYFEQMMSMRLKFFAHYDSTGLPDMNINPGDSLAQMWDTLAHGTATSDKISITENEIQRLTDVLSTQEFSILTFTPGSDIIDADGERTSTNAWFEINGLGIDFSPFEVQKPDKFLATLDQYLDQFDYAGWDLVGGDSNPVYKKIKDESVQFISKIPASSTAEERKAFTLYFLEELQAKMAYVQQNVRMGNIITPLGYIDNKLSEEAVESIFERMTSFTQWKNAEFEPLWKEDRMSRLTPEDQTLNMIRFEEAERGGYSLRKALSDWMEGSGETSSYGPYQVQYVQAKHILTYGGLKDKNTRREKLQDFLEKEKVNGVLSSSFDIQKELAKYDFLYRDNVVDEKELKGFLMTEIGGRWFSDRIREFNTDALENYFHRATGAPMTSEEKKSLPLYVAAAHNGGPAKVLNAGIQFVFWQIGVDLPSEVRTQKYKLPGTETAVAALNQIPTGVTQDPVTKQYGLTYPGLNPKMKVYIPGISTTTETRFDGVIGPKTSLAVLKDEFGPPRKLKFPDDISEILKFSNDLGLLIQGNHSEFFESNLWKKVQERYRAEYGTLPSPLISPENIRQYPMPGFMNYGLRAYEHMNTYTS